MSIAIFHELATRIAASADGAQLDAVAKLLWMQHGLGYLTDHEAEDLDRQIRSYRSNPAGFVAALGVAAGSAVVAAKRARRVKAADARDRMRSMAYGGWLPRAVAAPFTPGELAVLSVIAKEVAERGFCDLHVGTIAYRAGVCERTVRSARRAAVEGGLITCHHRGTSKNCLGSIVRIVSKEWWAWLAKRAPAKGGKMSPPCLIHSEGKRATGRAGAAFAAPARSGSPPIPARASAGLWTGSYRGRS